MINETKILADNNYNINSSLIEFDIPNKKIDFKNIIVNKSNIRTIEPSAITFNHGMGQELFDNNKKFNNHSLFLRTEDESEISIEYNFDKNNNILNNLIVIEAFNNTKINIIYKSEKDKITNFYQNGFINIKTFNDVKVTLNVINLVNDKSICMNSIETTLKDNSNVTVNYIDLGANKSYSNIFNNCNSKECEADINYLYIANNNDFKDINIISDLVKENSKTVITVEGAINDFAQKNFKGTIDFKTGSLNSDGKENEFCTILSDTAISKSLPILLCSEGDVFGEHSSASGFIDNEQLFYLKSRGIDEQEAKKIIITSRFSKILNNIQDLDVIQEINNEINRRLS